MFKRPLSLSWLLTRAVLISIVLVVSAFVWYATILFTLMDVIGAVGQSTIFTQEAQILLWIIHFSSVVFSALLGSFLSRKIEQTKFLTIWIILGAFSSLMLFLLNTSSFLILSLLVLLLGISLGIGMPAGMSYFSSNIPVEKRGRIGGVTLLISGIGIFVFAVLPLTNPLLLGTLLAIWRMLCLFIFLAFKSPLKTIPTKNYSSYKSIVGRQSFLTYFIPWTMFMLINYLAAPLIPTGDSSNILLLIKTSFLGLFAIIGGLIMDSFGRKRIIIAGFSMLGLSSAVLGFLGNQGLYFSSVLEGAAWGILLSFFLLILWGDLSQGSSTEKYYAIGVAPFFISKLLELTVGNFISSKLLAANALFTFTTFFLFLAILPLVYAPETLPEKVMKDRDLKSYVESAKKKAQKELNIENKKKKPRETKDAEKYEEAAKLAEKYY